MCSQLYRVQVSLQEAVLSLRDYGLPNPEPIGTPSWKPVGQCCPNCQATLCEVTVAVKMPHLKGGEGVCMYLGCPACPYASQSITRAKFTHEVDDDSTS